MDGDSDTLYNLVVGVLFTVAVSLNVYLIVDQMTDGQLGRELSVRLTKARSKLTLSRDREKQARTLWPHVLWDAINTVEGATDGD